MYMSQHAFIPVPSKLDLWNIYNRNYMSLTTRVPGAVLSRILREVREPEKFFAIGIWTNHELAAQWQNHPESKLGYKPAQDQGLYEGYPMTWSRWNLVDFAWGLEGPAAADADAGMSVKLVTWDIAPGMREAQDALNRAVMSLLARQPGFVSGETYCGHRGDRFEILYTFKTARDWPFGEDMPSDLRMLVRSDTFRAVREKTADPVVLDCTLFESVWGPERGRLTQPVGAREGVRAAVSAERAA
jgi:antibiotic biosynthesis monooxygenase (ABM) superfamily enzyme